MLFKVNSRPHVFARQIREEIEIYFCCFINCTMLFLHYATWTFMYHSLRQEKAKNPMISHVHSELFVIGCPLMHIYCLTSVCYVDPQFCNLSRSQKNFLTFLFFLSFQSQRGMERKHILTDICSKNKLYSYIIN